jgi:hypothetical protein
MGQTSGEKWTAAADLQPTLPKSDKLLGMVFKTPVMRVRVQNEMAGVPAWRVVCL